MTTTPDDLPAALTREDEEERELLAQADALAALHPVEVLAAALASGLVRIGRRDLALAVTQLFAPTPDGGS